MSAKQGSLPFPRPADSEPWPNGLGFDWRGLEFWTVENGVRDLERLEFGTGENWVSALASLVTDPSACD